MTVEIIGQAHKGTEITKTPWRKSVDSVESARKSANFALEWYERVGWTVQYLEIRFENGESEILANKPSPWNGEFYKDDQDDQDDLESA